jgi:hypothetical protein
MYDGTVAGDQLFPGDVFHAAAGGRALRSTSSRHPNADGAAPPLSICVLHCAPQKLTALPIAPL